MPQVIPKKNKDDIYRFLFTEGVITCEQNRLMQWEGQLGGKTFRVPCNHVLYLLRSMNSRGLVKEQFAWRHHYWCLNDEGVEYLRKYLHLAPTVVPNTQKKSAKEDDHERPPRGGGGDRGGRGRGGRGGRGRGGFGEDRAAYNKDGEGRGRGGRGRGGRGRGGDAPAEGAAPAAPAPAQE